MTRPVLLISVLLATTLLPAAAARAAPAGKVVTLRGNAAIERNARERPARVRDELHEADTVLTRERSRIKMLFSNDSVLTLGAKSRLVIRQYLAGEGAKRAESLYELSDGKLRAVVGTGAFKAQTPTAFAAARGTVFLLWYDMAANTTGIAVLEGGVEIRNIKHGQDRAIILAAGQMSTITGNEGPSPPAPFSIDLWRSGEDGSPSGLIYQELAGLGDEEGDLTIEDVDDTLRNLERDRGGEGQGAGKNDRDIEPVTPPVIEPPIEQQPVPPALVPITVRPVFQ